MSHPDVAPLSAAKTPVGPGTISGLGVLWSLLLIGIGAVGIQAALVHTGLVTGTSWFDSLVEHVDGLAPAAWMVAAGVVLALVGLWLVVTALRPRPRTAIAIPAATGVFMKPRDVARLAVAAAGDVDGVRGAKASANRRKISVRIVDTGDAQVRDTVESAVTRRLSALDKPMRVSVTSQRGTQ